MRRFAAIFKRNDKSDVPTASTSSGDARSNPLSKSTPVKKRSRFFRSLSVKPVQPPAIREPPVSTPQPPLPASSSSSSSTESPAPATPDDNSEIGPSTFHRRSNQWSERNLALPLPAAGGSLGWDPHQNLSSNIPPIVKSSESEDVDDESSTTSSSHSVSSPLPVSPHKSLHSLTTYALSPTFSAPPLLYLPNVPLFPRSTNLSSSLPYQETMTSTLHRTRFLRRLASRDIATVSEDRSVASFTSHRTSPVKSRFFLSKSDDSPVSDATRVSNVSQGLKQWISRPGFEDRMFVYTPGPSGQFDDVAVHNVSGGALGVAALEVSETVELLAGYNVNERSEILWPPVLSSSSTTELRLPAPAPTTISALLAHTGDQPYKAAPSPPSIETTPFLDQTKPLKPIQSPLHSSPPPVSPSPTLPINVTPRAKRVRSSVRFDIEEKEDKDEHVPLGQIMRIKRGREERAKFLELEKERRALEEERLKHEAEKKRWEQEKRVWEAEKKADEEEKKKRLYQQEVIAARKRRESQIFKVDSLPADPPGAGSQSSRRQGNYPRPVYDSSRRQSSDASSPGVSHPPSRNDSFNSLRGNSKPLSMQSAPPPSTQSSHSEPSAEDATKVRARRTSMFPQTPPQLPMMTQPYGYPWGMHPMPQMPMPMQMQMVPQMPYFAMDNMPLLPPAAPFMMQQAGDRRRSISSSFNRSSTSLQKLDAQSTDRLSPGQGTSSVRRSAGHRRSSSGGSLNQFGNGQRPNQGQGSVSSNRRSSALVNDPNQWRNSMRSRPPIPQSHSQGSGSWVVPSPVPQRLQNTVS